MAHAKTDRHARDGVWWITSGSTPPFAVSVQAEELIQVPPELRGALGEDFSAFVSSFRVRGGFEMRKIRELA